MTFPAAQPAAFEYMDFLARLAVDVLAMLAFAGLLHLRGRARRDLLTVFVCFNVGLLVVLAVISTSASATAIGFGLFAMLSIIRLRSEPFSNAELGWFFVVLVLALINGVLDQPLAVLALLDALVLLTVLVVDLPGRRPAPQQREITLDRIHADDAALRADLEQRLGVRVVDFTIFELDYVREVTRLRISFVPRSERPAELRVAA